MYYDLAINLIVVLFLCGVVIWTDLYLKKKYSHYILGVMFGLITILVISERTMVVQGRFFDFRHITMTMAGFVGSPITALIAALISSVYRYNMGGNGSTGGIISIVAFGCIGSILGGYFRSSPIVKKPWFWFFIGIFISVTFIVINLISALLSHVSSAIVNSIILALPFLIITTFATTIIFSFYFWSYNYFRNISKLKQMQTEQIEHLTKQLDLEEELSNSNQMIADIIKNMPDGFYVLDNQWRFTFVNKKAEGLLSKTKGELIGRICWDVLPEATLLEVNYQKAMNDCIPITFDSLSTIQADTWYQITAFPCQFGLSVYYKDITEQRLSRKNLKESQENTISILESMTDGFLSINREGEFIYINHAGEKVLGKYRNELLGKKVTEVFEANNKASGYYYEVMIEKKTINFEETLGNKRIECTVYPMENGLTCYFRDITCRKKAESEIARLDRLNLVGQLASGIAHEIRNPMTTVRGYLQLLGEKPAYVDKKSTFGLMISELDRANSIISEFLSLAQIKQTELKYQNLNDILNNLYPLLEADAFTQDKQISFVKREIPNLNLNGNEISQLVLNVVRNGLESMERRGSLNINSFVDGDKVVLAIMDEGCGIPPENLNKIGTPFFTTKDFGTGLGMATSYKIAESHNAEICINSSSSGTTFSVLFPIPEKKQEEDGMIAYDYMDTQFRRFIKD